MKTRISKKIGLSFAILSVAVSTSIYAEDSLSTQKSDLRNELSYKTLEENLLEKEIRIIQLKNQKRTEEYILNSNIEDVIDPKKIPNKEKSSKEEKVFKPVIDDKTTRESLFSIESYSEDQIVSTEAIEDVINEPVDDAIIVKQKEDNKVNVEGLVVSESKNIIDDSIKNISDEDLALLDLSREEYLKMIERLNQHDKDNKLKTNQDVYVPEVKNDTPKKVEEYSYLEVRDFLTNSIIIVGQKKNADITLNLYVGDGVNGSSSEKRIPRVKEGDIVVHKTFELLVKEISKDGVTLELLGKDKKVFKSSNK